jgi:hypothetical protein
MLSVQMVLQLLPLAAKKMKIPIMTVMTTDKTGKLHLARGLGTPQ